MQSGRSVFAETSTSKVEKEKERQKIFKKQIRLKCAEANFHHITFDLRGLHRTIQRG